LDGGNIRDARKLTHTIKGVSGNLCADELLPRSGNWKKPLLSLLPDSEFRKVKDALRKAMFALDTEGGISVLIKLSHKLNISFKEGDDK